MLILLLGACNIKCVKPLKYCLLGFGVVMAFIATSGGYLSIYYKSVSLEIAEGGLIKEYGFFAQSLFYLSSGLPHINNKHNSLCSCKEKT